MQKPENHTLPTLPGVYLYKDKNNKIIYVGKAINIRKRVLSYFRPEHTLTPKTVLMLSHAVTLDTITTTTEKEALLLEASLIKKHRPRYNIVLRDDKQYVLYKISVKDPYPRLEITRAVKKDGARYYGPFTSGMSAKETWKNIHRLFPLRRCSDRSFGNRIRPCLYHFIGQCLAPCTGNVTKGEYAQVVQKISLLLSGKSKELREELEKNMLQASENLDFEQAVIYRDQIQALEKTLEKQSTVLPDGKDMDVIGLVQAKDALCLGLVFVRNGMMIDSRVFHWQGLGFEESHELLLTFLTQYYSSAYIPQHIILPFLPKVLDEEISHDENNYMPNTLEATKVVDKIENPLELEEELEDELAILAQSLTEIRAQNLQIDLAKTGKMQAQVRIRLAKSIEENKLIEIAQSNARENVRAKEEKAVGEILLPYFTKNELGQEVQKLGKSSIEKIECVDVSHTFGKATKVGMVVFEKGKELKEEYRAWNIDANGDDYQALATWAKLRIERTIEGKGPFPDLILIDGGKGQLSAVYTVLLQTYIELVKPKDEILPFYVAAIAKARDEEGKQDRRAGNVSDRIFVPNRTNPLNMRAGSQELLYLQKIRDAAHNFSIRKHRQARTKLALQSELQRLQGVGEKTIQALWQHFTSMDSLLSASPEELAKVPNISLKRAKDLHAKLQMLTKKD